MILRLNKTLLYKLILIGLFLLIFIFRFNNALNYNTYWGYDGGKHLDYITTIINEQRLPTFQENYLAWHEPLYYFIFAILGAGYKFITGITDVFSMIKFLQILTALLDVVFLFIFYKTLNLLTENKKVKLLTLITLGFFTPLILINNYLTNELLLYWLIILTFYFIVKFEKNSWNYKKIILVSILSGLTLLTKLSALIFVIIFLFWLIYKAIYEKNKKYWQYILVFSLVVFVLNLPWQIYRAKNLGGVFTINNYELLEQQKLRQKKDITNKFWFTFDKNIFNNPFWQTGRNSFWSIIFSQTFVDYDNIGGNVDVNNIQKQVKTDNERYLSFKTFNWAKIALKNGFLVLLVLLFGYVLEIKSLFKNKFKPNINLFLNLFIGASFLALIFNVLKNPFIERGTLKLIFIISTFPWFFFLVFKNLNEFFLNRKKEYLWLIISLFILIYGYLSLKINWVDGIKF